MSPVRILSLNVKQSFCNLFRWRRHHVADKVKDIERVDEKVEVATPAAVKRALPPLPQTALSSQSSRRPANEEDTVMDFARSIQKVKDVSIHIA